MDESQHYAEQNKPDTNECTLYNSISYVEFQKADQCLPGAESQMWAQEVLRGIEMFYINCGGGGYMDIKFLKLN